MADPDDTWRGTIGVLMIIVFIAILGGIVYLLYGPGITITIPNFINTPTTTPAVTPSEAPSTEQPVVSGVEPFLASQPGQLFRCDGGRALKAEFGQSNVRLALSDGRALVLPKTVTEGGEVRYANANGTFVFLNTGNTVSVAENSMVTYTNCIASI